MIFPSNGFGQAPSHASPRDPAPDEGADVRPVVHGALPGDDGDPLGALGRPPGGVLRKPDAALLVPRARRGGDGQRPEMEPARVVPGVPRRRHRDAPHGPRRRARHLLGRAPLLRAAPLDVPRARAREDLRGERAPLRPAGAADGRPLQRAPAPAGLRLGPRRQPLGHGLLRALLALALLAGHRHGRRDGGLPRGPAHGAGGSSTSRSSPRPSPQSYGGATRTRSGRPTTTSRSAASTRPPSPSPRRPTSRPCGTRPCTRSR